MRKVDLIELSFFLYFFFNYSIPNLNKTRLNTNILEEVLTYLEILKIEFEIYMRGLKLDY